MPLCNAARTRAAWVGRTGGPAAAAITLRLAYNEVNGNGN